MSKVPSALRIQPSKYGTMSWPLANLVCGMAVGSVWARTRGTVKKTTKTAKAAKTAKKNLCSRMKTQLVERSEQARPFRELCDFCVSTSFPLLMSGFLPGFDALLVVGFVYVEQTHPREAHFVNRS